VINRPELLRSVRELGARFCDALDELDGIAEVRGRGLMVGVTLGEGQDAAEVARRCLDAGLVINVPGEGMLRFLPPLVIEEADVGSALEMLRGALA
jgi:acetylornithine aminotransferase